MVPTLPVAVMTPATLDPRYLAIGYMGMAAPGEGMAMARHPLVLHASLPAELSVQLFCAIEGKVSPLLKPGKGVKRSTNEKGEEVVWDALSEEAVVEKCHAELLDEEHLELLAVHHPYRSPPCPEKHQGPTSFYRPDPDGLYYHYGDDFRNDAAAQRRYDAASATATLRIDMAAGGGGSSGGGGGGGGGEKEAGANVVCVSVEFQAPKSRAKKKGKRKGEKDGDSGGDSGGGDSSGGGVIDWSKPIAYGVKIGSGSWITMRWPKWPFREADGDTGVCPDDRTLFSYLDSGVSNTTVQLALVHQMEGFPLTDTILAGGSCRPRPRRRRRRRQRCHLSTRAKVVIASISNRHLKEKITLENPADTTTLAAASLARQWQRRGEGLEEDDDDDEASSFFGPSFAAWYRMRP